ncbi:MAG: hypothetical protein JO266_02770 [Acidobacteria bacterium]|nr:hypothetical protein [Acidobacteriota bacterium]
MRPTQKDHAWHLASEPKSDQETGRVTLNIAEPITDEHYARVGAVTAFLAEALSSSAYAHLQQRHNDLKEVLAAVAHAFENRLQNPETIQPLSGKLDDLLSTLRGFDDRTSHALSQRYNKNSGQYTAFKQALSYEFDHNFAYRFSWHLRNYSQHRGNPISRIHAGSRLGNDGSIERYCTPVFDSTELLANYPEWHARVRDDLRTINGEFPVEVVVDSLMNSCTRAYSKLLLAQRTQIVEAIEDIRAVASEAAADDEHPLLAYVKLATITGETRGGSLSLSPIRVDLADAAESALRQAVVIVSEH